MNTFLSRVALVGSLVASAGCGAVYRSPSPPATGGAPGLHAQLLRGSAGTRSYVLVFAPGDDVLAGLTDFAKRENLKAAHFEAIGGFEQASLGWFDLARKQFRVHEFRQVEVVSMLGNVTLENGAPILHSHCVVADADGAAHGGHLLAAHVRPTLEVFVTEEPSAIEKQKNDVLGISLIETK